MILVSGTSFYSMRGDAFKIYGKIHHEELKAPTRLSYTQWFTDDQEKISRHPMAPTWPEKMYTVVELSEEDANNTRCDDHLGSSWPSNSRRTRNLPQGQAWHDTGLDGIL